jgi:hypothetical protein
MTRSQRQTYRIELNEGERYTLKTALSYCSKECRKALAQGKNSPISAIINEIRRIRRRLSGATVGFPAWYYVTKEALEIPSMHFAIPLTFTITLGKDEMMALDKILLHYQAHCRQQQLALDTKPSMWTQLDASIRHIRQRKNKPTRRQWSDYL